MKRLCITPFIFLLTTINTANACSVLYYVDPATGKVYVANNEDYWYDVKAYIQIVPQSKKEMARLWYGWDNFAQGGVNQAGFFFDGAVTPTQPMPEGHKRISGNLGDELLAHCQTVEEAIAYLEKKKIALTNAHIMFGDRSGNAVVVEWLDGERKVIPIKENHLTMTNFLISDPSRGGCPCIRYEHIEKSIQQMEEKKTPVNLQQVGNLIAGAVQVPRTAQNGKKVGTLYSSFINLTDMKFVLAFQLDNQKVTQLDLKTEFSKRKKRKIRLE